MRYRLRTLLIVLALVPPLLAGAWVMYSASRELAQRKTDWERSEHKRIYGITDEFSRAPVPPMPKEPKP